MGRERNAYAKWNTLWHVGLEPPQIILQINKNNWERNNSEGWL
jgi:hypothetical protein